MAAFLPCLATGLLLLASTALARQSLKVKDTVQCDVEDGVSCARDASVSLLQNSMEVLQSRDEHRHGQLLTGIQVSLQAATADTTPAPEIVSEAEVTNVTVDAGTEDTVVDPPLLNTSDILTGRVWTVWYTMDADNDGIVNSTRYEEVFPFIQSSFIDFETIDLYSSSARAELFTYLDTDHSGYISFPEWVNGMGKHVVIATPDGIHHPENRTEHAVDYTIDVHDDDDGNWIEIAKDTGDIQEYDQIAGNVYCEQDVPATAVVAPTEADCMEKCTEDSYCNFITFFLNPDGQQCWLYHTCYNVTTATSITHSWRKNLEASMSSSGAPAPPPAPPSASLLFEPPAAQSNATKAVKSNLIQGDGTVSSMPSTATSNSRPSLMLRQQLPRTPST